MSDLNDKLLEIKRQKDEYILPENLKKDVTVYGVTGTLEAGGDIKLFSTEQEMQQDPNPQDGDLAVVYGDDYIPVTSSSIFQYMKFPEEFTLDTAISSGNYYNLRFRAVDEEEYLMQCDGYLSDSSFEMVIERWNYDKGNAQVQYTSQDGKTFTKTYVRGSESDTEIIFNFLSPVHIDPMELEYCWNDVFTEFLEVKTTLFKGVFSYGLNIDNNITYFIPLADVTFDTDNMTMELPDDYTQNQTYMIDNDLILDFFNTVEIPGADKDKVNGNYNIFRKNNKYYLVHFICSNNGYYPMGFLGYNDDLDEFYIMLYKSSTYGTIEQYEVLELDFENKTYNVVHTGNVTVALVDYGYYVADFSPDTVVLSTSILYHNYLSMGECKSSVTGISYSAEFSHNMIYKNEYKYNIAPNQLNVTASSLLNDYSAYGRNGIVNGDGSIYDNLDIDTVCRKMGMTEILAPEDIESNISVYAYDNNICLSSLDSSTTFPYMVNINKYDENNLELVSFTKNITPITKSGGNSLSSSGKYVDDSGNYLIMFGEYCSYFDIYNLATQQLVYSTSKSNFIRNGNNYSYTDEYTIVNSANVFYASGNKLCKVDLGTGTKTDVVTTDLSNVTFVTMRKHKDRYVLCNFVYRNITNTSPYTLSMSSQFVVYDTTTGNYIKSSLISGQCSTTDSYATFRQYVFSDTNAYSLMQIPDTTNNLKRYVFKLNESNFTLQTVINGVAGTTKLPIYTYINADSTMYETTNYLFLYDGDGIFKLDKTDFETMTRLPNNRYRLYRISNYDNYFYDADGNIFSFDRNNENNPITELLHCGGARLELPAMYIENHKHLYSSTYLRYTGVSVPAFDNKNKLSYKIVDSLVDRYNDNATYVTGDVDKYICNQTDYDNASHILYMSNSVGRNTSWFYHQIFTYIEK